MGPKLERKARKKNKKILYGSTDLHIKFINFNNKSTLAYKNTQKLTVRVETREKIPQPSGLRVRSSAERFSRTAAR